VKEFRTWFHLSEEQGGFVYIARGKNVQCPYSLCNAYEARCLGADPVDGSMAALLHVNHVYLL
jgi:hypothetical protein